MSRTNLQSLIQDCISLGTASTLEQLGIHSGELSMRQAKKTYGKWFLDCIARDRIFPCRVENGHAGTRFYRVVDILALKVEDDAKMELKL
jgi:hypothetical protein